MFDDLFLRVACQFVWLCQAIEFGTYGDGIARFVGIDIRQCNIPEMTTHEMNKQHNHHQQHTFHSHPPGGVWKSASSLNEPDALTWLKLLFVPALGLLLLAALLEELCFAGGGGGGGGGGSSTQQHPTTLLGWLRQFCSRGPKLTTAYANQLKMNGVGIGGSHGSSHAGTCTCNHHHHHNHTTSSISTTISNATAALGLTTPTPSNDPSASSTFAPLTLQLNFNGFNQLSGPLQYYNTFTREAQRNDATNAATKMNGKSVTPSSPSSQTASLSKKKDGPLSPSPSSTAIATNATGVTTSAATVAASSSAPPLSEFMPLTLVNESTGFRSTFQLWQHLTFGEILTFYVDQHWSEERTKFEGIEGNTFETEENNTNTTTTTTITTTNSFPSPPLLLRFEGNKLSPLLTPAAIFSHATSSSKRKDRTSPSTIPVLEIGIDYFLLFDRARIASNGCLTRESNRLVDIATRKSTFDTRIAELTAELGPLQKKLKDGSERSSTIATECKKWSREIEKVEKDLTQLAHERKEVQKSILECVGVIGQRKLALEAEYGELKSQHDTLTESYLALKEAVSKAVDQRHEKSNELKNFMIQYDTLSKKATALKVQKIKHEKLQEKIRKLEAVLSSVDGPTNNTTPATTAPTSPTAAATAASSSTPNSTAPTPSHQSPNDPLLAASRMKQRYDLLEQEHNILNVQLNELRLASHEIDDLSKNEHYKLRYRLKLLEKDARDLAKWKSVARNAEHDAREAVRWKLALKTLKLRERQQEKDLREIDAWRRRARGVEKEVRDLRAWKRTLEGVGVSSLIDGTPAAPLTVTAAVTPNLAPPPSASAPPGFELRTPTTLNGNGHHPILGDSVLDDTRRRAHSMADQAHVPLTSRLFRAHTSDAPPDVDALFAAANSNVMTHSNPTFNSFRSSLSGLAHSHAHSHSHSHQVQVGLDDFTAPTADDSFDFDDDDFGDASVGVAVGGHTGFANFSSSSSWNFGVGTDNTSIVSSPAFDPTLLNSHTPNMRPRDSIANVGIDVAAAAAEPDPGFRVPAFLNEEFMAE